MFNHIRGRTNRCIATAAITLIAASATAAYYPGLVRGPKEVLSPGVTLQKLTLPSPLMKINVIEVDMTNKNVELRPIFKAAGNVENSSNERTSSMAFRSDAIAAVNAGFYDIESPGLRMTNSYTEIDGVHIGGANLSMGAEGGRSVIGFSGDHQSIPKRAKLTSAANPATTADAINWDKIVDAIAGRGHFVTQAGTVITQDDEGTGSGHADARHPRTLIGYSLNPYRAFLVTVDGRQPGVSVGATHTELARLMADLGVEQSISLDGGGSTTMWVKDRGIVNVSSDASERSVVSAWAVVASNTLDNTVTEATRTGQWTTNSNHPERYHIDNNIAFSTAISGPASLTWSPNLGQSGLYKVYAWHTTDGGRSTAVPYEITYAGGTETVAVNQRIRGGQWNLLGTYPFEAGTAGSVKLSNTSSGSVSADAVRFVRFADLPAPIVEQYRATYTLYQADFETNRSADFLLTHQVNNGNNSVNFNYDYSTFSQSGGGVPASIPQSPTSTGSGTRALRMSANVSAGVINAVTATLSAVPATQNMRISFDCWQNYNGGSGGGAGSTQLATFGGSANPTQVAAVSTNYLTGTNNPFTGFYFALSGDGGSTHDFRYYDGIGANARGNNATRANFLGTRAVDNLEFGSIFPPDQFESPGAPGKAWIRWEIVMLDGKIRLIATKPEGSRILMTDWITPNSNTPMTLRPHLGILDNFASSATPAADQFVLFDNLKVEAITSTASVNDWGIY